MLAEPERAIMLIERPKTKRKRIHYLLQPGWSAYKATQGLGRTHRSGQVTPPLFKLVTTNIMGQKGLCLRLQEDWTRWEL